MDAYYFSVKSKPFHGLASKMVKKQTLELIKSVRRRTKRRPYLRSKYFKTKVFITLYVSHLMDKSPLERVRRMKLTPCAFELIEKSTCKPEITKHSNATFYRFYGITRAQQKFVVQVKENFPRGNKYLISVFPKK